MRDAEKLIALCDQIGALDDTSEYQLLIRLLKERMIIDGDRTQRLRKKEEAKNPSEVLLTPSDPEATFRYKSRRKNLGYVGNIVESVGEKESLVTDYTYEKNIYADFKFSDDRHRLLKCINEYVPEECIYDSGSGGSPTSSTKKMPCR